MDEQQALAIFDNAAEQMRFLRDHEWLITNYAMIAYSALAAGSLLADKVRGSWRTFVSAFAFVLVLLVAVQAERVLWYASDLRDVAYHRRQDAVHRLQVVCEIQQKHPSTKPSEMPFLVRLWKSDPEPSRRCGEASQDTDSGLPIRPGLAAAVSLGAAFAIVFILSGIRWGEEWQRFLAWFLGSVVLVVAVLASVSILF